MSVEGKIPARTLVLWAMVVVNVVLLAVVIGRYSRSNAAMAQAAALAPGDYIDAPGAIAGQTDDVVFVLDTRNVLLSVMEYNSARNLFSNTQAVDVGRVLQNGAAAGSGVPGRR
jgi:hypothetical protein